MIKPFFSKSIFICVLTFLMLYSCKKNASVSTAPTIPDQSFVEEFDTASAALIRGWHVSNTSDPLGSGGWKDGGGTPTFFQAYSNKGNNAGFIGVDYTSTSAAAGTISNWLISPSLIMQNGDRIIFYTRSYNAFDGLSDSTDYGNSLQVRMNATSDGTDVGTATGVGSFTQQLLVINPNLVWSSVNNIVIAYPTRWTRFEVSISGLDKPLKSRFAFRYYVTMGGSNGNGTGIGIDSVAYQSAGHQSK
jgi:hypothetical protein